jgi:2-oxoglutarate ferredoxin oxidoreductase subunit alpha
MMSRIARECVTELSKKGVKIGLIRPITLWPFPSEEIQRCAENRAKFLVIEMSMGQMVEDVRLAVQNDKRVGFIGRAGGGIPTKQEILRAIRNLQKK